MNFTFPTDHRVEIKESEKIDTYLDLARELKKAVGYEGDDDTSCCGGACDGPQSLEKNWTNWKSEKESRQTRRKHCWNRL